MEAKNVMNKKIVFFLLVICVNHVPLQAQYQMLVLKKQSVTVRFDQGDRIKVQLKDGNTYTFRMDHIREFDFISQESDTIPFQSIVKIKFFNEVKRKYGTTFMLAGAALGAVYLINEPIFGSKNRTSLNGLRFVSLCSIGVGAIFYLTANSKIRLKGRSRILAVKSDSQLYRSPY
jgi:hypothetical protein